MRAVDGFGNIGEWEEVEFVVTPPLAGSPRRPPAARARPRPSSSRASRSTRTSTFYCSLDDRPFGLCESPKTYTNLWAGPHTFQVQTVFSGLDWKGEPVEFDPVPASHTWTVVDVTAPETSIDFGPPRDDDQHVGLHRRQLRRSDRDDQLRAQRPASVECEPGVIVELTDLTPGSYTFTAQAVDPVGNVDSTPASHSWTIGRPPGPPNTPVGDNVAVSLPQPGGPGNATVTFFSVDTAGFTALDQLGGGPSLPEGYSGVERADLRHLDDRGVRRARHRLPHLQPDGLRVADPVRRACSTSTASSGSTSRP